MAGHSELYAAVSVHYISNRIKIQRPETPETMAAKPQSVTATPGEQEVPAPSAGQEEKIAEKSAVPGEPSGKKESLSPEEQNELFLGFQGRFYTREGKVDPFEPFLRVPEAKVSESEQEKLHIRPPQTPLEKFDLSQLKLTAILQAPGRTRALVQESTGKGYIISEGTYIGNKGGQVSKILKDRIVVEEKYLDVLGKPAVRDIDLKLKKSED